ncbi:phosphoribosylaminoimidazole-succinocarboxamide synthase [Pelagirhabdus alkalitolerans]|uniref:Phosphoribosylaminoimidazole-succinocarboxamide synthase n=1 Tax=Pelagirhabdus alkalitolerans TaxID=1612202 RepID=A0A1G6IUN5_9BACI|nr:phosphoribosylaminoimidazolesuccinocarboxamide synthase [Pelagirhabdus alkalitolerans]SDC10174.1 phosphoribosylaminoimidazole-succinocarboxamide synthase [Pelagirhabdus alkalitolerans]
MTRSLLYEGKAKKVYQTDQSNELILSYKNDATAFNGKKKEVFDGKGRFNNLISSHVFHYLAEHDIPSHFIKKLNDTEQLVKKTTIIPLEVVVRNRATGSIVKRLGFEENRPFHPPLIEFFYKEDALDDPIINDQHALLLTDATDKELEQIKAYALRVNDVLMNLFDSIGVTLVDFKLEFGRDLLGQIVLADEISPDTCRLWDKETDAKLDKDVFRQGTGDLLTVYDTILKRLEAIK